MVDEWIDGLIPSSPHSFASSLADRVNLECQGPEEKMAPRGQRAALDPPVRSDHLVCLERRYNRFIKVKRDLSNRIYSIFHICAFTPKCFRFVLVAANAYIYFVC